MAAFAVCACLLWNMAGVVAALAQSEYESREELERPSSRQQEVEYGDQRQRAERLHVATYRSSNHP